MIEDLIQKYVAEGSKTRARMQSKLFEIFTETTGHRPEDLCLVEQQIAKGTEYKTVFFFDWKHRYQVGVLSGKEDLDRLRQEIKDKDEALAFCGETSTWQHGSKEKCQPNCICTDSDGPAYVPGNRARAVLDKWKKK